MGRLALFLCIAAMAAAWPAVADEVDDCFGSDDPETQRGACTAVIASRSGSDEDLSWAYYNRAYANYVLAAYGQTVRDLDEAIAIDPEYAKAYGFRCSAYIKLEDYEAALEDCSQDVALRPDNPTSYYNRALVHCHLGNVDEAAADMQSQWELAPVEVETDQRMLEERGFYDGPIDGEVSEPTVAALRAWAEGGC